MFSGSARMVSCREKWEERGFESMLAAWWTSAEPRWWRGEEEGGRTADLDAPCGGPGGGKHAAVERSPGDKDECSRRHETL